METSQTNTKSLLCATNINVYNESLVLEFIVVKYLESETITNDTYWENSTVTRIMMSVDDGTGDVYISNIEVINSKYNIKMIHVGSSVLVEINNIFVDNVSVSCILIEVSVDWGDINISNIVIENSTRGRYILDVYVSINQLIIEDIELIGTSSPFGMRTTKSPYFEAKNIKISSMQGLDFDGSYKAGIYSLDWQHNGVTRVDR